ncbi:aspartate aminotransferase family protein [soil metagenome]
MAMEGSAHEAEGAGPAAFGSPEPVADLNWKSDRARRFADGALDLWQEFLDRLAELPVTHGRSDEQVREAVALEVPEEPMGDEALLAYLRDVVLEWSMYPGHPRFMAYISGSGTVPGAVADLLAAAVNMNLGAWRLAPSATEIELHVIRWFAEQFGLPEEAGGLFLSGGAMANFVCLKIARDQKAGWDVRNEGVSAGQPLAFYGSEELHVVSDRAADMLGMGGKAVRKIPVTQDFRMRVDALREAIRGDRARGVRPVAVIASAGTVATGAIDPLEEIAEVCEQEGLWFHVDAAYGGPAILADDLRPLFRGIERADSVAFDPHKWLYTPHSGGCAIVRDAVRLFESFAVAPSYVYTDRRRALSGVDLGVMGPQFSRGFQALKVWVSLLAHGRRAYGQRISHDAALARYMGDRVDARPDMELAVPVSLSICCFRYRPPDLEKGVDAEAYLNRLNERLMMEVQLDGRSYCSNAILNGHFYLRACIVNFRTEAEDVDALLDVAAELGARLHGEMRSEGTGEQPA